MYSNVAAEIQQKKQCQLLLLVRGEDTHTKKTHYTNYILQYVTSTCMWHCRLHHVCMIQGIPPPYCKNGCCNGYKLVLQLTSSWCKCLKEKIHTQILDPAGIQTLDFLNSSQTLIPPSHLTPVQKSGRLATHSSTVQKPQPNPATSFSPRGLSL